jgi:hypothetical protein
VPLYFVDTVHRAIGLSHSGWRGTVGRMGKVTIEAMTEAYGTRPEELLCAIGPSICQDCYEVGEDVAAAFRKAFPGHEQELLKERQREEKLLQECTGKVAETAEVAEATEAVKAAIETGSKSEQKYLLDLWKANEIVLTEAGVKREHIAVTDICTCCNPDVLFSHRASHGKRGNLGGFLCLR